MHKAGIIGVGPDRGLGAQLCKRFAREGLHVVAAGRTQASLSAVVADIERSGGEASSFVADATHRQKRALRGRALSRRSAKGAVALCGDFERQLLCPKRTLANHRRVSTVLDLPDSSI